MFEQWGQLSDDTQTINLDMVPIVPETPVVTAVYDAPIIRTADAMPARGARRWPRDRNAPFNFGKKFKAPVVNLDQTQQPSVQPNAEQSALVPVTSAPEAKKPEPAGWFASLGISPWVLLLAAGGGLLLVWLMANTKKGR